MTTSLIFLATLISNDPLLAHAHTLAPHGHVKSLNKYAYLDIDDEFIHGLFDLIKDKRATQKPNYFSEINSIGAHITIAYNEENMILSPTDIDQEHSFSIQGLYHVLFVDKEYFVLFVHSPSLQALRLRHGLHAKPVYKKQPIDFHITIAAGPIQP